MELLLTVPSHHPHHSDINVNVHPGLKDLDVNFVSNVLYVILQNQSRVPRYFQAITLIFYLFLLDYATMYSRWCSSDKMRSDLRDIQSLSEAKEKCTSNKRCGMFRIKTIVVDTRIN